MKRVIINILKIINHMVQFTLIGIALTAIVLWLIGIRPYIVRSGSMEPTIMTGSVCFVNHNTKFEEIQENDIIAFELGGGTMVTHRAVKISPDGIITKGDNNNTEDGIPVTAGNFIGKTVYWIPNLGIWIMRLKSVPGIVMLVTFVIFLIFVDILLDSNEPKDDNLQESQK
ncbi:MAG: signal peptidase I [Ruminococcus sp.]|nr:signal peptidase I [Ruminococcus sp.]